MEDRFEKLKLNEDEVKVVQEVFEVFKYYDEGQKGELTKAEWEQLKKYMADSGYDMSGPNLKFEAIDKNGDGTIEFTEYLQLMMDHFNMVYDDDEH